MAATYRSSSSAVSPDLATSLATAKPSGVVSGDLLLAFLSISDVTSAMTIDGWTAGPVMTGATFNTHVFYKWAGGSEPSSYTASWTANSLAALTIVAVSGMTNVGVSPIDVSGSGTASTSTDAIAPSVTSTRAGLLFAAFTSNTSGGATTPSGMSVAYNGAGPTITQGVFYESRPTPGATGTRTSLVNTGGGGLTNGLALVVGEANVAPNAPTLVSPVGGVTVDLAATQRLSWTFSDPNPGDTQSKFDLRYRPAAGGTWTDITGITPNNFYDLPAATLTAGDYEWQVRTYDSAGVIGPYSSSSFFTAATVSNDITISAPTNGATISTETFTVTWSTPTQTHYQLRVVADLAGAPDTATVIYDTGEIASSSARSRQVSYPDNGVTRHTQVRKKQDGLWSDWASVSNPVSYTAPAVPSITVDDTSQPGAIQAQATHPTPTGSEPTVSYMDVWRRRAKVDANGTFVEWYDTERDPGGENGFAHRDGSQLAPTAIFTDWFVNGSGYSFRVRAVGANGTSSYSEWSDDGSGVVTGFYGGGYGEAS